MDQEKVRTVRETLDALEERLLTRTPKAADRSPDTLSEEIEALNEALELKMKLSLAWLLRPTASSPPARAAHCENCYGFIVSR